MSPASEFKKGVIPKNKLPVGSVTIRNSKHGGTRAYVKVAEPNVWKLRAVVVWESIHGPLAKGLLIHHRDRDALNDAPDNLEVMTRAQHIKEHHEDFQEQRTSGIRAAWALKKQEQAPGDSPVS